jgi:hypothetical protein
MRRILDRRSTFVFVIGVLALVVATSSTAAYAAVARNSVLSASIKDGAVKTRDLGTGAVSTDKLAEGNVTRSDLAGGSVSSDTIVDGTLSGADIADGAIGSADIGGHSIGGEDFREAHLTVVTSASAIDADGTTNGGSHGFVNALATCPAGAVPVTGGAEWVNATSGSAADKNLYIHSSYVTATGWFARGVVDMGAQGSVQLRVHVECLVPTWGSGGI